METKTVIVYKTFPDEVSARLAGFTIKGVSTRAGEKWGQKVVIQKKKIPGKPEIDDLAGLLEVMGMDTTRALHVAEHIGQNPEVVLEAPAGAQSNRSSVLGPSIFGAASAAAGAAAGAAGAGAAGPPLKVDMDALEKLIGGMGLKGGKRRYKNKKQKKSRKQRKTKRKMTKRK